MNVRAKLQKTALVVSGYLLGLMITATTITWANVDTISSALGQPNSMRIDKENTDVKAEDLEYFKSDFKNLKERRL